jgi:cell division septum initiation protein DivIVA
MNRIGKKEINNFLENLKDVEDKINELEKALEHFRLLEKEGLELLRVAKESNPELFKHTYS